MSNRLKCPSCAMPTIEDKSWSITEEEMLCDKCYATLADDDMFVCETCHSVCDIDDSVRLGRKGLLVCTYCADQLPKEDE